MKLSKTILGVLAIPLLVGHRRGQSRHRGDPALRDEPDRFGANDHAGRREHKPRIGTAQDFSRTVTYTVTAADGSTKPYTVTVTAVDATPATSTYTVAKGTNAKAIAGLTNEVDYTFTVTCVDTSGNTSVGTTAMARPQGYSIGSRGARRRLHLLCQREFPQRRLEIHGDGYERGSQRSMGLVL